MTREEAIAYGKRAINLGLNDETQAFCELAIKALEQEPILNKIRAEIQSLRNCSCSCSDGIVDDVEDIIDKYNDAIEPDEFADEFTEALDKFNDANDAIQNARELNTDTCKWIKYDNRTVCPKYHDIDNPYWRIPESRMDALKYCPYCGKEIEVIE